MQNTYLNGVDIRVEPFDLTDYGAEHKLDLLFYNNINRQGEILSSLVYNSGVRDANDQSLIVYNPNTLFLNTSFEVGYTIADTITRWKNADLLTNGLTNLKNNNAGATNTYGQFDINVDYAVSHNNGVNSYDGWYSFYSIHLQEYANDGSGVLKGTLRYGNNTAQYAETNNPSAGDWKDLDTIDDTSIAIYNFMREDRNDNLESYDFMVTVKTLSLYKSLLENKLEGGWYKRINILNSKLRTLDSAIEFKHYDKAQHIINAISNSLLSLLI